MTQTPQTQTQPSSKAAEALASSILAPRDGEDHPYLMPVATASHCATFDAFDNGLYLSYPRRIIWVDFDNGNDENDGTQAAPLKTLQRVFSDKLLACVCQHIGQDRIPVCCKGTYVYEEDIILKYDIEYGVQNLQEYSLFTESADYCRHLEIMPWPHEARPVFKIKYTATMPAVENAKAALYARMTIAEKTHGIYWNKCDFVFEIDVTYSFDKQYLQLDTELYGFDKCEHIATIDCNMHVIVNRYNARLYSKFPSGGSSSYFEDEEENKEEEKKADEYSAGWPGTGSHAYHGPDYHNSGFGGSGGGKDSSPIQRDYHDDGEAAFCYLGIMHYRQCNNAFVAGGSATWQAEAKSNYTALIYSAAFEHCANLHARNYTLNALSVATAQGGGEAWTKSDGSHGVKSFELEPTATTRIASGCSDAILHNVTGNISAKAYAKATNTPYTTTADGVTTYHEIGGKSTATAIAYAQSDKIDDGDKAAIFADATHPNGNITITTAQKG